jgi:hypothetical protein
MATKKKSKKTSKKKNTAVKKARVVKRSLSKRKAKKSAKSSVKPVAKKSMAKSKPSAAKKASGKRASSKKAATHKVKGKAELRELVTYANSGLGARTGGQSGDTQGLSGVEETDSESVKELLEEGQSFEAEVVGGVENVPDADQGEVRTHEVPEDDVPGEYLDKD